MRDDAHIWTDEQITALEQRVRETYEEAYQTVQLKLQNFLARFAAKDAILQEKLKNGEISQADYRDWLRGQVFQGKRWQAQVEDIAQTLNQSNQVAVSIINEYTPDVFAYNANWAAFQIENAGGVNMGFGLYDADTVTRLLRDEPNLLPPSRIDIPKDLAWNTQKITSQINQGIILGESLMDVAKRLQRVTDMNRNTSLTHARTALTGAQNAGRIERYHRVQEIGINLRKEWLAALDNHTRATHAKLDGQKVPTDEPFRVDGYEIMYPGDPNAAPEMVYNCRCTLIADLVDYPAQDATRRDGLDGSVIRDMTFEEWMAQRNQQIGGMYRKTENTGDFAFLPERMSKKHVREIAKKYGISLKGVTLHIIADKELLQLQHKTYGCAAPEKIGSLYLYPYAFESEEQLTLTIFHEKIHINQFKKYGSEYVMEHRDKFEDEAYAAEKEFSEKMRKVGLF